MFIGQRRMTSFHTITTYKHTMSTGWQSDLPPFKKKTSTFQFIYIHGGLVDTGKSPSLSGVHHCMLRSPTGDIFTTTCPSVTRYYSGLVAHYISAANIMTGASFNSGCIRNSTDYWQTTWNSPQGIGCGT